MESRHSNDRRSALGGERGFTVIEILAGLLLLSLAASIALPALTSGSGIKVQSAARIVAAGLRQTRDRAMTTNRDAIMELDVRRRRMALGSRSRQLARDLQMALLTARRERIDAGRGAIRFFPDGSSTGGRVTLVAGAQTFLVDVDWLTGRVSLRDGELEAWEAPTLFEPERIE